MATTRRKSSNSGITCVRISLVTTNFVTLLAGVATLAVGVLLFFSSHVENSTLEMLGEVAKDQRSEQTELPTTRDFQGLSIVLICLGTMVAFISFFGCFGACIHGKCFLAMYLILVGMILTLQFLVSVFAIVYRQPMSRHVRDELLKHIRQGYHPDSEIAKTWDLAHQTFGCCGAEGFSDWFEIDAWPAQQWVPDSCCIDATNITGCGQTVDPNFWYKQGCLSSLQFALMERLHYLASIIIILVFLQLYGIIGSTLLLYHKEKPKATTTENSAAYKNYSYELASRRMT